jgi:hypothetical protein
MHSLVTILSVRVRMALLLAGIFAAATGLPPGVARAQTILATDWGSDVVRKIVIGPPVVQSIFIPTSAGLDNPSGLVRRSDGSLFVGSGGDNTVKRFNGTTGQSLGTFATGAQIPIGVTFGPDGHLYVASRDGVGVLRYNGTTGAFMGRFATASTDLLWWAFDLAFGPQGDLFLTSFERGRVLRFNGTTGALIGTFVSVTGTGTSGLTFAPNGDLFVAGFGNGRIYRFNGTTGQALGNFDTGGTELSDIVYAPDGFLYASFNRQSGIYKLNPLTGARLATYSTGSGINSGTSSILVFAPEIAVHDGNLAAPQLSDGQTAAVDFSTTRQPTPVTRTITVANPGNEPLVVGGITVPAGYSLLNPPTLPATIAANGSLALLLRLNADSAGTVAGSVTITSNDPDEAAFDFPVTGRVITPEIALHNGATIAAPELNDGQTEPVDFGTVRQGTPQTVALTVSSTGTAPLLVSSITVPQGYTALDLPPLPVTIAAAQSLTFRLQIDAAAPGTFAGSVAIASDDLDEPVFEFPVAGTVVSPEIAVHDGDAAAPELADGQGTPVGFGRNVQGTPATRPFTVTNTGTAGLLISGVTVPPGYTALNLPPLPLTLGINQAATFQISLTTLTAGTHAGSVVIVSDDLDEATFDFPVTGEVFIPDPVGSVMSTTTTLNRQTGLREQTIHITNDTTATVPAYNLIIRGLPAGVEVNNASETRADGSVVVYIRQGMQPHSTQDIVIEYYSPNRAPAEISPQLSTEVVLTPPHLTVPPGGASLTIDNITRLPGGEMMIEFTSVPGQHYQIQYSTDGQTWQASLPQIRAAANRTQWIDRGLPRTESHPNTAGSRLYRVLEMP